tara:strand:+ start:2471 stop:2674 length:204 start_codon:yes stop_codon:yes gene_type:complete
MLKPSDPKVQAIFLKGHLKLMSLGMKNSKMSGKQMLALATNITGQNYKRGQYIKALQDLEIFTKGGI